MCNLSSPWLLKCLKCVCRTNKNKTRNMPASWVHLAACQRRTTRGVCHYPVPSAKLESIAHSHSDRPTERRPPCGLFAHLANTRILASILGASWGKYRISTLFHSPVGTQLVLWTLSRIVRAIYPAAVYRFIGSVFPLTLMCCTTFCGHKQVENATSKRGEGKRE